MYSDTKEGKLQIKREYSVVKSNALIQRSRFDLTLQEQKIVLSLIQKITPNDDEFKLYDFTIKEFCELVGIDGCNGKNYIDIKKALKSLSDKSMWITLPNGVETVVRWVEKPYMHNKSGLIQIKLDKDMMPYLLKLREHFTEYSLYYTIALQSRYSIRFYELFKSYENVKQLIITVDELKKQMFAEKYTNWNDFKKRVLTPAITEINTMTDITIDFDVIKKGRAIGSLKFDIHTKTDYLERTQVAKRIQTKLNSNQLKGQTSFILECLERELNK